MFKNEDEKYMSRCIQLARLGEGTTSPNPMVGAVVVCDGRIIGEGFHRKCGEAHAEVNAIVSVKDQSLLKKSTIYVSLEPCSHWGKTPPCSKLIIEKQIPRVVVGIVDTFSEVSGRGIKMLRDAGVEVTVGVLESECRELNKAFFTRVEKQRPYVILKWAQSSDGFIDKLRTDKFQKPVIISNEINSILVHKLRTEVDAIMVGTNTVIKDNPRLNARKWFGNNPVRITFDSKLRINRDFNLMDGSIETLVYCDGRNTKSGNTEHINTDFKNGLLSSVLKDLAKRNIQSVLVEGGRSLLTSFIEEGLWDEARVEVGSVIIESGINAPVLKKCQMIEKNIYGESLVYNYKKV